MAKCLKKKFQKSYVFLNCRPFTPPPRSYGPVIKQITFFAASLKGRTLDQIIDWISNSCDRSLYPIYVYLDCKESYPSANRGGREEKGSNPSPRGVCAQL